jgi:Xaa-Pro dipeptidase
MTKDLAALNARLERLNAMARKDGFDIVALVPGSDLYYVTGAEFHLSNDRPLIIFFPTDGSPAGAIVPRLEEARLLREVAYPIKTFSYNDAEGFLPAFERAVKGMGLSGKRVAVEGMRMRVLEAQLIEEIGPGTRVIAADNTLSQLRLRKGPDEIALMRRAIAISEEALARTLDALEGRAVGMTEQQITNILLGHMGDLGGGANAFDPIVLTGANSALPHGHPGDTPVQFGDLLLFDFGTKVQGYPADITRTVAIGALDPELVRAYDVVLKANRAGLAAGRPGVQAQAVDRAARKVIADAGLGEYFTHRTGHGLGLDIHEHPNMREGNTEILEPGMCYSVEPGVYMNGKGGIRIEDDVVVTQDGSESLTNFPRELRIIRA